METNTEKQVLELIREYGNDLPHDYADTDLLRTGVLDSLGVMQLSAALQDAFRIELDVDDVSAENFDSVAHIVALVGKYLAAAGKGA